MSDEPSTPVGGGHAASWWRDVVILALLQVGLGAIYLKTVPRFYNDDAFEASLGHSLAYEGTLRHGIYEGWGGMHIHFLQNQVVQPLVLAATYRLAGFGIVTSRLASVLAGMVAVISVYGVMRRWLGRRSALLVGLATILHPWFFEVSRRVRPDIYAVALAFAVLLFGLRAMANGKRGSAFVVGVLTGLAGLAHPTGLVLVATMAAGVVVWQRPKRLTRMFIWGATGFVVAILPYVIYVLWAVQHPDVKFLEQMVPNKPVVVSRLSDIVGGELERWGHFLQWPKGIPLAAIMFASWILAWYRSTRTDKTMATTILLFAIAMPFTSVNYTSRYLTGLIPLFGALLVRLIERIISGCASRGAPWRKCGLAAGVGIGGAYALICLAAIGLMFHRLREADLTRLLDRVAAVTGPEARVYGETLLWIGRHRYRYGPFPVDQPFSDAPIDMVRRHHFDYAVRSAWRFGHSHGVSIPPKAMPDWRPGYTVDEVCRRFGTKVAAFRDPHFGPMEIYTLDWDKGE